VWTASTTAAWIQLGVTQGSGWGTWATQWRRTHQRGAYGHDAIAGQSVTVSQAANTSSVLLSSVSNAASYNADAVAPGQFVVLTGSSIGPKDITLQTSVDRFPTTLQQTSVLFDGVAAPIYYVWGPQTAVIVPYSVDGKGNHAGGGSVSGRAVECHDDEGDHGESGIFSQNASGRAGSILNQDGTGERSGQCGKEGDIVVIFATAKVRRFQWGWTAGGECGVSAAEVAGDRDDCGD